MEEWKGGRMEAWKIGRVGGWKAVRCLTWRAAVPRSGEWETDSGRLVSSSEAAIQESLGRQAKIGRMEEWKIGRVGGWKAVRG